MAKRFHFSLKSLLIFTCFAAILCACGVFLYQKTRHDWGYGPYDAFSEWPRSLVEMIGSDTALIVDVEPYGLGNFIDHRSIWRIKPGSPLRQLLFDKNTLAATNADHPKVPELIDSVPSKWKACRWEDCNWYATPGYGSKHIEGLDLFLVAENPDTGGLVVLHEWIF